MLVEFRVKNFRSFKEEQVLSLVATKDNSLENNKISTSREDIPSLLRSAVIYGANASGKSNLIKAIECVQRLVKAPATVEKPLFDIQPFRLNQETISSPITFEMTFTFDRVRYRYNFSFTGNLVSKENGNFFKVKQILSERLVVYQETESEVWFNRDSDKYEFSVDAEKMNQLKGLIGPDTLFLSIATQTCESQNGDKRFLPISKWFNEQFLVVRSSFHPAYSINTLKTDSEQRQKILDLMTSSDTGITDIQVDTRKQPMHAVQINPQEHKAEFQIGFQEVNEPKFIHEYQNHYKAKFNISDESQGTIQLLGLAGPIGDILEKGRVLIIDEFDTHLHPLLARRLVKMFHDPEKNKNNAQLIFVTHNISLLGKKSLDIDDLFRRDQIWFIEKDHKTQESTLYPLSDFKAKKDDDMLYLEDDYLLGCYGAIPFLSD